MMREQKAFEGIRVVDLSSILAGPSVASFFAELGAEVVKFENPRTGGDATRTWKLASEDPNLPISAYFASVNFGKTYKSADLSTPDGINEIYRAVKGADIIVMNFKPGDEYKFGLDYERLKSINPRIIYAHLTGFEHQASRPAFDVVLQAETGYMSMNGTRESGPVKMPVALIDVLAAHQLKEAILIALWKREKTGKGAKITCSLEAAALSALMNQAGNYLMAGHIAGPMGTLHPNIAPYGEYFTGKDGKKIVLAVGNDKQFETLCNLLDLGEVCGDKRFSTNAARVKNRFALAELIRPAIENQKAEELSQKLNALKIPCGIIRTMDDVLQSEAAKSMILTEQMEGITTKRLRSAAFKIS